jgi:hypothetical protein
VAIHVSVKGKCNDISVSQSFLPKIQDLCHCNTPRILTLKEIYFHENYRNHLRVDM